MSAPDPSPADEDGGLQFERTAFAWWRTSLASVVAAFLIFRQAAGGAERWVTLAVTALALGSLLGLATWRTQRLARRSVAAAGPGRGLTTAMTIAVATLQVVAVILVL